MDEFTSIAIWFLIGILAINASVVAFGSADSFNEANLGIGYDTDNMVVFSNADVQASLGDVNSTTDGTITSTIPTDPLGLLSYATASIFRVINWIIQFYFAWYYLLAVLTAGMPGGSIILSIVAPIVGIIQIVATGVVFLKAAGVIGGIIT